jgi:hypothetical protein
VTRVIDSYELSPLQAGMLLHAAAPTEPGLDIEQVIATLYEPLDEGAFLRAWERVLERHAVLRTRFRWQGVAEPVQEVVERAGIPVQWFDWRTLSGPERRARLEKLVDDERARGLDPAQAPLMRLALARMREAEHAMVWTVHHLLLDARSRLLVLQELFACYEGKALAPPAPYRAYIEWLRGVDHERSRAYWRDVLAGFRAPTPLVVARKSQSSARPAYAVHECRLPAALSAALRRRAREARITLDVLLQGAWALLLQRYSGEPDVVFGVTRDVRPHRLADASAIAGLLINTLPVRIRVDPDAQLLTWLQTLRQAQRGGRDYAHTPLVRVHGWSEVPREAPLFETLFVFDRHRLDAQLRAQGGAWTGRRFSCLNQTNYPLTLAACGDEELLLELRYSRRRLDDAAVERMGGHLHTLLAGMAAAPFTRLRDLPWLTAAEHRQVHDLVEA